MLETSILVRRGQGVRLMVDGKVVHIWFQLVVQEYNCQLSEG